jgi:hypothetical protein
MDVECAVWRELQEGRRKQRTVCRDDDNVGPHRTPLFRFGGAESLRLCDLQPSRQRETLDRTRSCAHAAPRGPVGLGDDEGNLVSGFKQRAERLRGEFGRAGED